ncbi:PDC sensor domain-containing protein [Paenibacillus sp. MBLB4367]|uniref:PDC sensor domain-containing protein n=1 Tax=Paenibacillus sp. MBLB4367 TaxID=3384767 RepID=UPI003908066F
MGETRQKLSVIDCDVHNQFRGSDDLLSYLDGPKPEAGLLNAKGRDWWRRAMDGELFVSSSCVSAITKKPCITISYAIVDGNKGRVGVVGLDLRVD